MKKYIYILLVFIVVASACGTTKNTLKKDKLTTVSDQDKRKQDYLFLQAMTYKAKGDMTSLFRVLKHCLEINPNSSEALAELSNYYLNKYCRHPLVYLVEAADDICYQMMDIEDAHKLKIISTEETKELFLAYFSKEKQDKLIKTFDIVSDKNEQIAYLRSSVIGKMIKECTNVFVENEEKILNGEFDGCLINSISEIPNKAYANCSALAYKRIYRSQEVVDIELAGFKIISTLLSLMIDAVTNPEKTYSKLLINRVSEQYDINAPTLYGRIQAVLDFVSGMTDVFALDLYRKINGNALPAV